MGQQSLSIFDLQRKGFYSTGEFRGAPHLPGALWMFWFLGLLLLPDWFVEVPKIRSAVPGAPPLLLWVCSQDKTQTLKYSSVRGAKPWGPKSFGEEAWGACFSPSKKGCEGISNLCFLSQRRENSQNPRMKSIGKDLRSSSPAYDPA